MTTNMKRTTTISVRLSRGLCDFVAARVGKGGIYQNVGEYIRDLVHQDMKRVEQEALDHLKAELAHAFLMPDATYKQLTATEVIARNRVLTG